MSQFASRDFKPSQQYKHTVVIRRNEYVACGTRFYSQIAGSMSFLTRAAALEIRPITRFIIVLAMLAIGVPSTPAEQQPSLSFQVPKNDWKTCLWRSMHSNSRLLNFTGVNRTPARGARTIVWWSRRKDTRLIAG